jgi:hypothetical protein
MYELNIYFNKMIVKMIFIMSILDTIKLNIIKLKSVYSYYSNNIIIDANVIIIIFNILFSIVYDYFYLYGLQITNRMK